MTKSDKANKTITRRRQMVKDGFIGNLNNWVLSVGVVCIKLLLVHCRKA
jgi:hypothetical protein